MTSKLAQKTQEFIGKPSWAASAMSCELVVAARTMLELALDDRRGNVYRLAHTHPSSNAIGAIALIVMAFDAFLNEVCDMSSTVTPGLRELAVRAPTIDKYQALLSVGSSTASFDTDDLEMLIDVRNEIAHYLPRPTPNLIERLEARGLLMSSPRTSSSWDMGQKLPSYALAYWAFETIEAAVVKLVEVTPSDRAWTLMLAENFSLYRYSACPPANLGAFDAAYNLRLTEQSLLDAGANGSSP